MKKIAILGANGNLGHHAVEAFTVAGWQVRAVTRDGQYKFSKSIETRLADAMDADQLIAATEGCDFIFNGINPLYPQWSKMCMPLAQNVMAAANAHQAVHLFPGNVYNYGSNLPAIIDEDTTPVADTKKGRIRLEMEQLFAQNANQGNARTIILRAGDFFGGTASTSWFNLAISKKLSKGIMTYPGPLDKTHSWAYLPDLAKTFVKLAERTEGFDAFETFHFEGHAIKGMAMKKSLEQITGREITHKGLPWPLIRFAGIFSPMLKEVCEMSYLWDMAHQLDEANLVGVIGEVPHTRLHEALSATLGELGMGDVIERGVKVKRELLRN